MNNELMNNEGMVAERPVVNYSLFNYSLCFSLFLPDTNSPGTVAWSMIYGKSVYRNPVNAATQCHQGKVS